MKITLIAGEASGDRLGGRLMAAIRHCERSEAIQSGNETSGLLRRSYFPLAPASADRSCKQPPRNDKVAFSGVGGTMMEAQGLRSFFPMQELSLMGFAEVLPHIFRLKRRIRETAAFIERENPDVLVTIDSPGFNFRVVKRLRERGRVRPRFIHYVAPTVWAYKPQRAEKTARLFDHLLVLLPFEPPYFEREGLAATFVGHPVTEEVYDTAKGAAFRKKHGIKPEDILLCVMPGSRKGELQKLLPVFTEAVRQFVSTDPLPALPLKGEGKNGRSPEGGGDSEFPLSLQGESRGEGLCGNFRIVIPVTLHSATLLEQMRPHWPTPPIMVVGEEEKNAAMLASDLALAKSGTVTLEAAMAGLPMITAYQVSPLSAWLLRRMKTTHYFNLINILENREIIPEYMQEQCTAGKLAEALTALWRDEKLRAAQRADYGKALEKLYSPVPGATPSMVAAQILFLLPPLHERSCASAERVSG